MTARAEAAAAESDCLALRDAARRSPQWKAAMVEAEAAGVHPGRLTELREDSTLAEVRAEAAAAAAGIPDVILALEAAGAEEDDEPEPVAPGLSVGCPSCKATAGIPCHPLRRRFTSGPFANADEASRTTSTHAARLARETAKASA